MGAVMNVATIDMDVKDLTPVLDTSAYAAGDVLFIPIKLVGFFKEAGQSRALHSIILLDSDDQNCDVDLLFFNADVTLGTLNGAVNISDADAAKMIGYVSLTAASHSKDLINSRLFVAGAIGQVLKAASTSTDLWVAGVCRSGTPTYTASGMKLKLGVM